MEWITTVAEGFVILFGTVFVVLVLIYARVDKMNQEMIDHLRKMD